MDHQQFAVEWIACWNSRDLARIIEHYAADVIFRSPRIVIVTGAQVDMVKGRDALAAYWSKALALAPDLHFTLVNVYSGAGAVTIRYRNHRGQDAAETMVFNAQGLIQEGIATYAQTV
jgi:ketosteroid isomerase-like protein